MQDTLTAGRPSQAEGERPAPRAGGPAPRLLLVEDNPLARLLIGSVIESMAMEHVAVGCGEEALLRFAREPFDAVLLDIEMDGMAGITLARGLLALAGSEAPPVLALGCAGLPCGVLEEAGFAGSVEMPVDRRRLSHALIAALECGARSPAAGG